MYSAEKQLTEALPKMAEAVSTPELEKAFQGHLRETQAHMEKVRQIRRMAAEVDRPDLWVQVDGGIAPGTAGEAAQAGADVLVAGSAVFRGEGTIAENVAALRDAVATVV